MAVELKPIKIGGLIACLFIFASCRSTAFQNEETPTPSPVPIRTVQPTSTIELPTPTSSSHAPTPIIIPVAQRTVWFAPLPPMPQLETRPFIGSDDFLELFSPDSPWQSAASRIGVFKLYGEWVAYHATDEELNAVIADLKRRQISIAVEAGPLLPGDECGQGVEGFAGLGEGLLIARRIKQAGGKIDYLALDEPFYYAQIYEGPNACLWTTEQIALAVQEYRNGMQSVFPDLVVGDTEPLPAGVLPNQYMGWLDSYRQVTGTDLSFIHLDLDYHQPTWAQFAREIEEFARSRGILFGIIYNGEDLSDETWLDSAWERVGIFEEKNAGRPDHILFQSWDDHPDRVLPENQPAAFTHLVNRYFRPRSIIRAKLIAPESSREAIVEGQLTSETGEAIPNARMNLVLNLEYAPSVLTPMAIDQVESVSQANGDFSLSLSQIPDLGAEISISFLGSDEDSPLGSAGYWPAFLSLPIGRPGTNIATGQEAVASHTNHDSDPAFAVDGNPATTWSAGDFPRHFIEVNLGEPSTVEFVRLLVSQFPAGKTIHWIWGKDSQGVFRLLKEVGLVTDEWDVIDVWFEEPWDDLVAIRIETVQSPSWVAWREIEIVSP